MVYEKINSAKIYNRGSHFSAGPYTTNFKLHHYRNNLYPKIKGAKDYIFKVSNSIDKTILKSIMEVARPSYSEIPKKLITSYQGQPHHYHFIPQVFKKKHVVATEVPVHIYDKKRSALITGHIDMVAIIGKNIYICDYKPDRDFSFNPNGVSKIFVDTIPQISTYALIFSLLFADEIKKGEYNVYTFTFNKDDGVVMDPYHSLKIYTEFYEEIKFEEKAPPWKWVLEQYKEYWKL